METSIEVANCKELIAGAGSFTVIAVCGFKGKYHVFCPISTHEILIMGGKDVLIFDTRNNGIE